MKILRYLNDGNTVSYSTPKNFNPENISDNSLIYEHNPKFETAELVINIQGIWVNFGLYSTQQIEKFDIPNIQEKQKDAILNSKENESFYVRRQVTALIELIDDNFYIENGTTKRERLKVFEQIHQNFIEQKRKNDEEQALKEKAVKEQKEKELEIEMNQLLSSFQNDEKITWVQLLDIVNYFEIEIHPRTKGFLNDHANHYNSGFISKKTGNFMKKKSNKSIQSFFDFIKTI